MVLSFTVEEALAASMTEEAKRWRAEAEVLFTSVPTLIATCDELTIPKEPPLLIYCPTSCLASAIEHHEKLIKSEAPQFREKRRRTSGTDVKGDADDLDYKVVDVGGRSVS